MQGGGPVTALEASIRAALTPHLCCPMERFDEAVAAVLAAVRAQEDADRRLRFADAVDPERRSNLDADAIAAIYGGYDL